MSRVTAPDWASIRNTGARPFSSATSISAALSGVHSIGPDGQRSQSTLMSRSVPSARETTTTVRSTGSSGVERFSRIDGDGLAVGADARVLVLRLDVVQQDPTVAGRHVDEREPDALSPTLAHEPGGHDRRAVPADVVLETLQRSSGIRGEVAQLDLRVGGGVLTGEPAGEDARGTGTEVLVPEPHRHALVQDRGDLLLLALLALGLLRVMGVRGREGLGGDHHRAGVGRDMDVVDAPGTRGHDPCLAPSCGQQPQQRFLGLVVVLEPPGRDVPR